MKKYKAKYEVFYNTPPKHPQVKAIRFVAKNDEVAEGEARFRIAVSIGHNQSAKLLTLVRLEVQDE